MLFNSCVFVFAFLPVVLAVYLLVRHASAPIWPIGWLVIASLVYFGWWDPKCLLLLLFATRGRLLLALGVTLDLCLLGYFKYRVPGWVFEVHERLSGPSPGAASEQGRMT